jgi:hypothetical protein
MWRGHCPVHGRLVAVFDAISSATRFAGLLGELTIVDLKSRPFARGMTLTVLTLEARGHLDPDYLIPS